ncbi:peptide ABC transporter substrate-binding protein [Alicyclobacillus sp. SO9]|uniref:peptide ABC transporter substrate-binding protein n=1 Tax=Alicyclobacillus sp. SO9 TaxID=2665646 RepID=UPI0018E85009|nr:peptide ABC transporter substrate-binding protein [Alicyclobacillus sp. SO9]QQE80545.1 peptide ABC transporter substrate-binding protein [Alicyclobacillus sp. SO9]
MERKRKHSVGITMLAAMGITALVAGCGGATNATNNTSSNATASNNTASKSGVLSMYMIDDGHGFDPSLFSWEMYQDGMGIFEGLVHMGPNGSPVAGMAQSWNTSKNGLTWTFQLRNGIKFSNGDPITAQDFVYGFRRAVSPADSQSTKAGPAPITNIPLLNASAVRAGTKSDSALGIKAVNASTVEITLSRPDPGLLKAMSLPTSAWMVPLDKKVVSKMKPADWTNPSKIVSNGPYMLKSYTAKTQAILVPNPHYYKKVKLKEIKLWYSQKTNQLLAFKNGSLDLAVLKAQDVSAVNKDSKLKSELHMTPTSAQYSFQVLPSKNKALLNVKVRKAFQMAIDRKAISKGVLKGTGTPAYGYWNPTWLDPWIKDNAITYNPSEAKKLMAQAGYPGGKGFPTVMLYTGNPSDQVAQAIQQEWQNTLGVKVVYKGEEWGQFLTDIKKQLPANEVGFGQTSTNAFYPSLELPTTKVDWLYNNGIVAGFIPPSQFQNYYNIQNNKSIAPNKQMAQEAALQEKYLPSDIKQWMNEGLTAYKTNSQSMMKKFFIDAQKRAYTITVYTPLQPILVRSNVSGYHPNRMLLIDPPVWFGYLSKS